MPVMPAYSDSSSDDPSRKKLIAYIDRPVWDALQERAKVEDRSATAVVRVAVAEYLERNGGT